MRIILGFVEVNLKATGLLPILCLVILLPTDTPVFIIQVQMSLHFALVQTHGHTHCQTQEDSGQRRWQAD